MAEVKRHHVVGDLSGLPDHAFGVRNLVFWGTLAFMLVEGMGLLLACGGYLYLRGQSNDWPPGGTPAPDLLWGTLFTVVLVLSWIPNMRLEKASRRYDKRASQLLIGLVLAFGLVASGLRAVELANLNTRWDANAYGSIVWALMVLHTTHVVTDLLDTAVLTAFMFTHDVDAERFADVEDNAGYWTFVVVTWLPIYALVYWAPRLL